LAFDLTEASLVSYLLQFIRDTMSRNPRFRRAAGEAGLASSNAMNYKDLQVVVSGISTSNYRMSFDYFISTSIGRALHTQVQDKDGLFIEWISEVDKTQVNPPAGTYYFNVDSVDESNCTVELLMASYRWYEGRIDNATGTKIAFSLDFDPTTLTIVDTATQLPPTFIYGEGCVYLTSRVGGLLITSAAGVVLTPSTDYWVEGIVTSVLIPSTTTGTQIAYIPPEFMAWALTDQDGYPLVLNTNYYLLAGNAVQLTPWTPSGQTISVTGTVKQDPTVLINLAAPENTIPVTLNPGESLVETQAFVTTQDGAGIQLSVTPAGVVELPTLLPPGGYCRYEIRVSTGSTVVQAHKNQINKDILPGLYIAIGDVVNVGDQAAIIVAPRLTETYRIYGGKPDVSFTIEVRANDPTTASNLASALRNDLFIGRREQMESDGLTIYDGSSELSGVQRDESGTAPSFVVSLTVNAAADWRVFQPLVTRITDFNITVDSTIAFPSQLRHSPRAYMLRTAGFIPSFG
jgi:hypothetical protein